MKEVQINGGPLSEFKLYVGPVREVTAETTNWELRLHDATLPGGHRFLNLAQNDQRYQGKSVELDGFDFAANLKGFLVRVAPSTSKLRTMTVDTANLYLNDPLGLLGNPKWGLATNITSDHNFLGTVTFTNPITSPTFIGNLTGSVTGSITGNTTGNLTGNVTGDLTGNVQGTLTGSIDTRLGTVQMAEGQILLPYLNAAVIQYILDRGVPLGGIIMWGGSVDAIPAGWQLCDGTNGTTNLEGFFIRGAGATLTPHTTGGNNSHSHVITVAPGGNHGHTLTIADHILAESEIPSHRHLNGVVDKNDSLFNHGGAAAVPTLGGSIDGNSSNGVREGYTTNAGGGLGHTHAGSTADAATGSHSHDGSSASADNIPVYYALAYIMKVV